MRSTRLALIGGALALAVPALILCFAPALPAWAPAELVLDATGRLFLGLVQLVFLGVAVHTAVAESGEDSELPGRMMLLGFPFLLACDVAILADAPGLSWAALEISTLLAAPLVGSGPGPRTWASLQYFLFSSVALGLVLLGFTFLEQGVADGGFSWQALRASPPASSVWVRVGLALALAGYGTKLGLFPLNPWVATTYSAAPGPVAALLGAVQFNAALVGLLRLVEALHGVEPALMGDFLRMVGLATMATSTLGIVTTRDYKRLFGYASVNHAGVIAFGLGLGAPASYGVLLYAASNAFIKAILFLSAGRVEARFGSTDARVVRGLVKLMPQDGLLLMVGSFALLGLPPFGSFLGELLIFSAVVESGRFALLLPFCGLLTVSFVATGRTLFPMIWGQHEVAPSATRLRVRLALPKLGLLGALVLLGLYVPAPVNALLREVAAHLGGP